MKSVLSSLKLGFGVVERCGKSSLFPYILGEEDYLRQIVEILIDISKEQPGKIPRP